MRESMKDLHILLGVMHFTLFRELIGTNYLTNGMRRLELTFSQLVHCSENSKLLYSDFTLDLAKWQILTQSSMK